MTDHANHPNPERLWRHRRWMAWSGLCFSGGTWATGMVVSTISPEHAATALHPLVAMGFWGGLVPMGAYIGNCALDKLAEVRHG